MEAFGTAGRNGWCVSDSDEFRLTPRIGGISNSAALIHQNRAGLENFYPAPQDNHEPPNADNEAVEYLNTPEQSAPVGWMASMQRF